MAAVRDISSLPIPEEVIVKLHNKGFRVVQDLVEARPLELANEISVELTMAVSILQAVKNATSSVNPTLSSSSSIPDRMTAQELLDRLSIDRPIITFSKPLDSMLGGGIQCGQITEICGPPGVGKTQLAIQLSLTCQIPEVFSGNHGECIYIDTEGSFLPERVLDMATEISTHLKKLTSISLKHKTQEIYLAQQAAAENMSAERFLQGIHVFRVHSSIELLATIKNLTSFLQFHPRIKLIIIDSIAFPFRSEIKDMSSRNRTLSSLGQILGQLSFHHRIAIVLTNHVTTRIQQSMSGGEENSVLQQSVGLAGGNGSSSGNKGEPPTTTTSTLVPALGETWSHLLTHRLLLHYPTYTTPTTTLQQQQSKEMMQVRSATLVKSSAFPPKTVDFVITKKGIRDVSAAVQITAQQATIGGGRGSGEQRVTGEKRPRDT